LYLLRVSLFPRKTDPQAEGEVREGREWGREGREGELREKRGKHGKVEGRGLV